MRAKKTFKRWSADDVEKLTELYADTRNVDLSELLGFTYYGIYQKAQSLGLKKSAEFLRKNICPPNSAHFFKKGHKPTNAYKKGHVPDNTQPLGTESIRRYNNIFVKTESGWQHKHKIIWEQINGKVPKGKYIIFADKDNRNFNIENLICVDKAELMRRNSASNLPTELCSVINQLAWYHRKLKNYEK